MHGRTVYLGRASSRQNVATAHRAVHQPTRNPTVYFGGSDRAPRFLRNLLEQRIDAVPQGGSILWATYYFRDEALAEALVRAHRRGVILTLCIEGKPRKGSANEA